MFTPGSRGSKGTQGSVRRTPSSAASALRSRDSLISKRSSSQTWSQKGLLEKTLDRTTGDVGHALTEYGAPIPVSVTEALTSAERGLAPNAVLDKSGWAWLVSGRKLIVWNYRKTKSTACSCFELVLPHSAEALCSSLVRVFEGNGTVSCCAVSREGGVRYWRNVNHEGGVVEGRLELSQGEQCDKLINLHNGLCIVGTKQSSLFLIQPASNQAGLSCRQIKDQPGSRTFLGKFLPWSSAQPGVVNATLQSLLAGEQTDDYSQAVYVLRSDGLQKWNISVNSQKILYQYDALTAFRENMAEVVWKRQTSPLFSLTTELLDMQLIYDGLMVLGAAMNASSSSEVRYGLGTLHTEDEKSPNSFLSFIPINHTAQYDNEGRGLPRYSLLLTQPMPKYIYLYNSQSIISISDGRPDQIPEVVEFNSLGAGSHEGLPVFLSSDGYLVCIEDKLPAALDNSINNSLLKSSSFAVVDTSIVSSAKKLRTTPGSEADDRHTRLKAAFFASMTDSAAQSQALVNELFPPGSVTQSDAGSSLDVLVADLSREMVDDYPASDPRWGDALPKDGGGSTASLILLHQLDDKLRAHELYLRFLKNSGLWDRLSTMQLRGSVIPTTVVLCEHAEKIEATKALREAHNEYQRIVNATIDEVVRQRGTVSPSIALTSHDLFYRERDDVRDVPAALEKLIHSLLEVIPSCRGRGPKTVPKPRIQKSSQVSHIDDFIVCLIDYEEDLLNTNSSTNEIINLISTVNSLCLSMLMRALEYRRNEASLYSSGAKKRSSQQDFLTWTSSNGRQGIRASLKRQHAVTVERGVVDCEEGQQKQLLYQQLLEITDLLLEGYRQQLSGLGAAAETSRQYTELIKVYEKERETLIEPFIKHKQYERATTLSEKFCHFSALVRLCEETRNDDRLKHYMEIFKDENFSDFVFKWYMDAGKRGKLMTSHLSSNPMLARFLQTKENQFISWIHDISVNNYNEAHKTLMNIGKQEQKYVGRKKTLLSLSKLAALAGEDVPDSLSENLESIDNELNLLMHQEQLMSNPDISERYGMDSENMKVLNAVELIDLLIDDYNPMANEMDFKKALDLIQFIDQDEADVNLNEILLRIWSRAVLRDKWERVSTTDLLDVCRDTVFYKLLSLIINEEMDLSQYLPSVDDLLESELLVKLSRKPDFVYLIRGMYEHVSRVKQTA